jgi:hypothetical protein
MFLDLPENAEEGNHSEETVWSRNVGDVKFVTRLARGRVQQRRDSVRADLDRDRAGVHDRGSPVADASR